MANTTDIEFTLAATENILECDVDVAEDLKQLRDGRLTRESLLLACLDGADEDRVEGWRDYVSAVSDAAR